MLDITNSSIQPIDRNLTGTNISGQSALGSNDNEGVLHIPQNFMNGIFKSDGLVSYPGHSLATGEGFLPLCRDAISVFYRSS